MTLKYTLTLLILCMFLLSACIPFIVEEVEEIIEHEVERAEHHIEVKHHKPHQPPSILVLSDEERAFIEGRKHE